jgi:hypothetical protein
MKFASFYLIFVFIIDYLRGYFMDQKITDALARQDAVVVQLQAAIASGNPQAIADAIDAETAKLASLLPASVTVTNAPAPPSSIN